MYYQKSCAATGNQHGSSERSLLNRFMQRAAVNIYRTENSYEMLVFAPGRIKDHFRINTEGKELKISYMPPEGFPRPDWIQREYSRGGFMRSFVLGDTIDAQSITARYEDGVLYVSLPFSKEAKQRHDIMIS